VTLGKSFCPLQSRWEGICLGQLEVGEVGGGSVWDLHWEISGLWWPSHLTSGLCLPHTGICLAYFSSGFNTAAVDHEADGSTNNGIFQISSRKWCKNLAQNAPNLCRMYCSGRLGLGLRSAGIRPYTNLHLFPV
jgi:hypothetical protein